jgi:predicted component of type VI protein secretion system
MTQLQQENQPVAGSSTEPSEFANLLMQEFKPKTDRAREAVETAVRTLAEQALAQTDLVSNDAIKSIESIIAAIDAKLTAQVNQVIHHPDFQQLESAWRGLHYLVNNTESDEQLKIRVLNISKTDLHKTLKKFKGTAWARARSSRRCTKKNTASSAANLTVAWWAITTSTSRLQTWNCWANCRKSAPPCTRHSSQPHRRP